MRKALITGASSGIGKEIALYLDKKDYELFLVGRDYDSLRNVALKCKNAEAIPLDLSKKENVLKLYDKVKDEEIEILVNDAGFGLFGFFDETDLDRELDMINVNVIALHILTKLFLKDMINRNEGYILNVASSAGFLAGPYLSTYYASKNYALKLTMAINEELKQKKSKVSISALCPGPVDTGFNRVAGGHFNTKSLTSKDVAKYAVNQMFKKKMIIIPSFQMKFFIFASRFISYRTLLKVTYKIQKAKTN